MKLRQILIIMFISFCFGIKSVKALTKEDLYNLKDEVVVCDSMTKSLLNKFFVSYQRILNERDVDEENLTKIYNNVDIVINILKQNNICSISADIPFSLQKILYHYYENTLNIINSLSLLTTNEKADIVMTYDSEKNAVNIYEDAVLNDVIDNENYLNDVGINKIVYYVIYVSLFLLVISIILNIKYKNDFLLSMIYAMIIIFSIFLSLSSPISNIIDSFSLSRKVTEKQVVFNNSQIISYPAYGQKIGSITIFNESEDIYMGDSADILKQGVGLSTAYFLPGEGKTVLSSHNTKSFQNLNGLKQDDEVKISLDYGNFTYKVVQTDTVLNTDISALEKDYDLILYTCQKGMFSNSNQRIIVYLNMDDQANEK